MVRKFLGNIKGDKGDQGERGLKGDPGEPGGFNGESIGVNNIIEIGNFSTYDSASVVDSVDFDSGIVNYSNMAYYMFVTKKLRKGVYTFRIKDYTVHSDVYGGKLRFQVRHADTLANLVYVDVDKDTPYSFDIDEEKEYRLEIRVSGVNRKNGFIEKPMLVEGEYSVLWSPSETDKSYNTPYMRGRLLPEDNTIIPNENKQMSVYSLQSSGITVSGNTIVLKAGLYIFSSRHSISFGGSENTLHFAIYQNGSTIARFSSNVDDTLSTTQIIKADNGDVLTFEHMFSGTTTGSTQFHINNRNEFSIARL